jgi:hypothetical protein
VLDDEQRDRALQKPRASFGCSLRWRDLSLDFGAERVAAIARTSAFGCKKRPARMRDHVDRRRELSPRSRGAASRFARSGDRVFQDSSAEFNLDSVAISQSERFRARAARILLNR